MPIKQSGKRLRVPWRGVADDKELPLTLPVYMAYCAVAGSLRPWNRLGTKSIITLVTSGDFYFPVFAEAARFFASQIWQAQMFHGNVMEWSDKNNFRHQAEALRDERAILFAPASYELQDDDRLLSDAVVQLGPRTSRHAEAALRRAGLPVSRESVEMLLTEPWSRLSRAFQDRRQPLQALHRLRSLPKPVVVSQPKPVQPLPPRGPTLSDMHGYGSLIEWGYDLAQDIADFKNGIIPWSDVENGVLISGPPGVGKTMFASALANSCSVPVIYGSASRWQEAGALDEHLKAMRASFTEAKEKAPSILFIDEIDVFGNRGEKDRNSAYMRSVITALLQLLDGFERREGVIVLGACNHPDLLDPAIKRAGRLDRHIGVPLPDAAARRRILVFHSGVTLCSADFELFDLATEGLTGADIERIVRDAKRAARRKSERLSSNHIVANLRPLTKLPEAYLRALAVHEAGHAVVSAEVGHSRVSAIKISRHKVEGEIRELGYVEYQPPAPQRRTRVFFENAIATFLGGIAAELEVYGSFTDGAGGADGADLNRATDLATALEGSLGMGYTLVAGAFEQSETSNLRLYLPELRREVHDILETQLARARSIIRAQRPALDAVADRLLEAGELAGDEVFEIIGHHRRSVVSLAKPLLRTAP
ncbi:AAA family ATPase (plasmid) [Rhizobium grahamii]|uniref:AAA family ATPase n=1 Tax=Rhizobium grahamii TaxID=1120045 RepID=A0A5Q0CCF3_9HYPH|nr:MULTISPECIES: AAA family ATPase [Rhizobium]QFY63538.1 AAA family ATPase [Rhizobium grahamii]QRM51699.1 AAA family ATPase [Rhizobium sp. BG6]